MSTRKRRILIATALLVLASVALNVLAAFHARAMTRYAPGDERTAAPEALGFAGKLRALLLGVRVSRPVNLRTPANVGLAFETLRLESEPGVTLELWRISKARSRGVAVLCHGYAASKEQALAPAKILHDLGWETLLVDFRGSGGSSGNETTLGHHEARDVSAAVERARVLDGGRDPILFGHSMGAVAILRAVHAHGARARGLILEAPFDRMLTTVENRFRSMGVPSFPAARLLVFWGGRLRGFDALAHDPIEYAKSVEAPTLVMGGELDPRVTRPQLEAVGAAIHGPRRVVVFAGIGHEPLAAARPDEWRAAVEPFLAR